MVAANPNNSLSLLDIAKRTDPNGDVPVIAELLSQKNEVLIDMPWKEGNLPTGTRNTIRTGLPQAYWKRPNAGTTASKSTTAQIDEAAGILEAWCVLDYDVAMLNGNAQKYRMTEADPFIESLSQQLAQNLIYGNSYINPERFQGLSPRFGAISGAVNAQNILNAGGGASGNTSVWLIGWGENTVYGIYPRGSIGGLQHWDFGDRPLQTSTTFGAGMIHAYVDLWHWYCGLAVKDWRFVVRCANISVSDLVNGTGTQGAQQLIKLLSRMRSRIPSWGGIRPVFYCNRTVQEMLMIQGLDKSQNILNVQEGINQFGQLTANLTFLGIPIRINDQLLLTESQIS
jgi:hypothetical protein